MGIKYLVSHGTSRRVASPPEESRLMSLTKRRLVSTIHAVQLQDVGLLRSSRVVLRHLIWRVRRGGRWIFVGPNRSGQSSLLRIVGACRFPTSGEATILAGAWAPWICAAPDADWVCRPVRRRPTHPPDESPPGGCHRTRRHVCSGRDPAARPRGHVAFNARTLLNCSDARVREWSLLGMQFFNGRFGVIPVTSVVGCALSHGSHVSCRRQQRARPNHFAARGWTGPDKRALKGTKGSAQSRQMSSVNIDAC